MDNEEFQLKVLEQFSFINNRFDAMDKRLDTLENQVNENTQILKSLLHLSEVNKAEHDKMMISIAHIEGDVSSIRKDLSTVEMLTANNYSDIIRLKAVK